MFSVSENVTRHSMFAFEDVYDFTINLSFTNSGDIIQVMGFAEMCYPFADYLHALHIYYIPVIVIVGFVGNILSFLVLSTTHLKLRSSSYYLAALAVSDFGFLVVVSVVYCSSNDIFEIYNKEGFCQFFMYLGQVCAFLSVWLTVAFTTERFIAVKYPLKRQYICTVSRARSIVFGITTVAMLSQVHVFWVAGLSGDKIECTIKPYYMILGQIMNYLDTCVTFIIPVFLIIIMNVIIAKVVFRSHNLDVQDDERYPSERVRFHHVSSLSSDSTRTSDPEYSNSSRRVKYESKQSRRHRRNQMTSMQIQQNINKMLLLVSSAFIAFNFPSYFLRISAFFESPSRKKGEPDYVLWCAQLFAQLLYYTNFSINFLLYAMCGKSFRLCLKKMFRNAFRKLSLYSNI